jgi:hypothetical protein
MSQKTLKSVKKKSITIPAPYTYLYALETLAVFITSIKKVPLHHPFICKSSSSRTQAVFRGVTQQ